MARGVLFGGQFSSSPGSYMLEHHIRNFGRFPVSQFDDSLGGVDLKGTQWVHFRSTQPKLYFSKIMEFSQNFEYGVLVGMWFGVRIEEQTL